MAKNKDWIPWALRRTNPDIFYFKDDGITPNSHLPILIYRGLFRDGYSNCDEWLADQFIKNGWFHICNMPILGYYHYHSNTHQVLGVYSGSCYIKFAAKNSVRTELSKGDVVVIPAGVGHYCNDFSDGFKLVGAYPVGDEPDIMKGLTEERTVALENIKKVKIPDFDPILGDEEGGLRKFWT
ncbi:MAG: cupin domain-containing protein [Niabella sp.]